MKNFISYTLIIFFSSLFMFTGLKTKNLLNNTQQKIVEPFSGKDTSINKLPEGYQYISNFSLIRNKKINSVAQDISGIMLFADNNGITFFDGKNERTLFIEDAPNIIKKDKKNNAFYIACRKGFGMIIKENTGGYIYQSLSEKRRHNENYSDIIITSRKIFFISNKKIVSIDPANPKESTIEYADEKNTVNHAFIHKGKLYLNLNNSGIYFLEKDSIIQLINDPVFSDHKILFDIPFDKSLILGTDNNELFLFDGNKYSPFKTSSDDYIKESIITNGTDYDKDWFVITTLNGGAVIINKNNGDAEYTINYRTGLPDDEIITSYVCNSGGLWLSHEYGISRVAFDIPVKNFGYYPGIQGKINSIQVYDSTLYVATGQGLYYLSEIKSYDEVKVATDKWVKSRIKINVNTNNNRTNNISPVYNIDSDTGDEINEDDSEETGFFKRWKNRKNKKNETDEPDEQDQDEITDPIITDDSYTDPGNKEERYKTEYKKVTEYRKIYELQSVKYSYKKISGINSKCKELKFFNNGLLAITNSGLYFVKGHKTKTVIPDEYIYCISGKPTDNMIFAATSNGIYKIYKSNGNISASKIDNEKPVYKKIKRLYKINDTAMWAGYLNKIFLFKFKKNRIISSEQYTLDSDINEDIIITKYKNKPAFISNDNAFYLNNDINDIIEDDELNNLIRNANNIYFTSDTSFIISGQNNSVSQININKSLPYLKYAWLVDYVENITFDDAYNIWVVSRDNMIYKISPEKTGERDFKISINDIKDKDENSLDNFSDIKLGSDYKRITLYLSSPCFLKNDIVTFYYGIDTNNEKDFIESSKSKIIIPELTPGNHTIYLFAVNEINEKSETLKINIEIKPPFWKTNRFLFAVFVIFIILISLTISGIYKRKQRKIKEYNEILELKVKERTAEIQKQNKLIQEQNSEIIEQNEKISFQNEEITGSIRYAGKIQKAALPETDIQSKYLSGFFNLFKPRDIVSGDFYWMTEAQNKLFIAAVDCTGHGVPGGFLSMLGISFLNEIVIHMSKKTDNIKAGDILNVLRNKMITTLSQHNDHTSHDGMDMALVVIDKKNMLLNFAGANNSAYIIRNNQLNKIEADRMPVGFNKKLNDIDFTNKFLKLKMNDAIYLFSDGYADQFGGENNKKFNSRRFRELLLHLQKFPMIQQKNIAETILKRWQKDNIQIDDILLIGIKI